MSEISPLRKLRFLAIAELVTFMVIDAFLYVAVNQYHAGHTAYVIDITTWKPAELFSCAGLLLAPALWIYLTPNRTVNPARIKVARIFQIILFAFVCAWVVPAGMIFGGALNSVGVGMLDRLAVSSLFVACVAGIGFFAFMTAFTSQFLKGKSKLEAKQ